MSTGGRWRRVRVPALTGNTTPARLRRVGVLLVVGCLVTAVVSLVSGLDRSEAVRDSDTRVAALTSDAAALYRSLADADATATSGYVAGGRESAEGRARYDADIAQASERLVHAGSLLPEDDPAAALVDTMTSQLPVYAGLMETARTYNRQGLPLGQSYLARASKLMQSTILSAAAELRRLETVQLMSTYQRGSAAPLAVLVLGVGLLIALVDLGLGERARTNRVLSPGLVGAAAAVLAALLWWGLVWALSSSALGDAERHTAAATALDDAHTAVLKARSNESLILVARGGGRDDKAFIALMDPVLGADGGGGLLAQAEANGASVGDARTATLAWLQAHREVRELDNSGRYAEAAQSVIGNDELGSGGLFADLDAAMATAVDIERAGITSDVDRARAAQTLLAVVPAVLFLLAGIAAAVGIAQRTGEYR